MRYRTHPALAAICVTIALLAANSASAFLIQDGTFDNSSGSVNGGSANLASWGISSEGVDLLFPLPDLLAPDTIVNDGSFPGVGRIEGVTASVVGLAVAHGAIHQLTGGTFIAGHVYTLSVDITSDSFISADSATIIDTLASGGVGIAITSGGTAVGNVVADSTGDPIDLDILSANTYRLTLSYTAEVSDNGNAIGARLFVGEGSGLVFADVIGAATFDNVTLVPESGTGLMFLGALGTLAILRRRARGN